VCVGTKGILYSPDDYGGARTLLSAKGFEGFQAPPKSIPDSPGHHAEWIRASKGGDKNYSNFDYAGPFTEFVLLGNVAIRAGKKIEWDAENLKVKNCPEADPWIKRERMEGMGPLRRSGDKRRHGDKTRPASPGRAFPFPAYFSETPHRWMGPP